MLVLHGCWVPSGDEQRAGHFFVWGGSIAAYHPGKRRGRPAKKAQTYPLAVPEPLILETLNKMIDRKMLYQGYLVPGKNVIMFPALPGHIPVPPYLAGVMDENTGYNQDENKGGNENPVLQPWLVNGIAMPAHVAVSFLACLSPADRQKNIVWADDLLYWGYAAKFALELLIRQRFIPSITAAPDSTGKAAKKSAKRQGGPVSYCAAWEAVLDDPGDAARLRLLAGAMPALCRGVWPSGDEGEHQFEPVAGDTLIGGFLSSAVDGLVRAWYKPGVDRLRLLNKPGEQKWPEKWISALFSNNPLLAGDTSGRMEALAGQALLWGRQFREQYGSLSFRTCFRLEPPDPAVEDEKAESKATHRRRRKVKSRDWMLSFHLQAGDDPSLLVSVEKVWQESKSTLKALGRKFENPQERLLADLARASAIFPPIRESLNYATPSGCALTAGEAHTFLKEAAPLLEESGLGVQIPSWWQQGGGLRPGIRIKVRRAGQRSAGGEGGSATGLMGLNTLVEYDWELSLGDRVISREEFEKLAELKTPLVRVRGQWVEFDPGRVENALKTWEQRGGVTLGELIRRGTLPQPGAYEGEEDKFLPVIGIEGDGPVSAILDRLEGRAGFEELAAPDGFRGTLRRYQQRGLSWLHFLSELGLGACLADDMGLGKTIQLIAILLHRKERNLQAGPVLLICPTSVLGNWRREIERFGPSLAVLVHHGAGRLGGEQFDAAARGSDVVISTYTLAHRDIKEFKEISWDGIVLDEAQNIKNSSAKQTRSIRSLQAGFKIALTGTPVENRLTELWSIMDFLNNSYLGTYEYFRSRFAVPIERYGDQDRLKLLQKMVQPFILRRVKTDPAIIDDLPEKQEIKVFCHLTPEQATLYQAVVRDMLERIEKTDGMERRGLILAALAKLKQICNHPAQFTRDAAGLEGRSGKLSRLAEILEEVLATGDRALIFSQFTVMGEMLKRYLQQYFGREVLFLHGQVSARQRDAMVARFQEEKGGPEIFILSLKAGGVGLNLTRANHVIHFDRWWNPAVENQATDRAFRIGQKKNVLVHKFICSGTLEERIDEMIERKKALAESVISQGEGWLTELDTGQLRELFALGPGALGDY